MSEVSPTGYWCFINGAGTVCLIMQSETMPKLAMGEPNYRFILSMKKAGGYWRPRTFDEIIADKQRDLESSQQAAYMYAIEVDKLKYMKAEWETGEVVEIPGIKDGP